MTPHSAPLHRDWLLALALALAAFLRLFQVGDQVVVDDETYTLRGAAEYGFAWLATHLDLGERMVSFAPALGLYVRAAALTVGLEEWALRMPSLLAGIALPIVLARGLRAHLDRPTLVLAIFLVAISPILIHHSRIARPYVFLVLLECGAAFALWRALTRGGLAPLVVHSLTAGVALWLNRSAGVCLASLWLASGVWWIAARAATPARQPLRILAAVAGAGVVAGLLYAPAWILEGGAFLGRPGSETIAGATLTGAWSLAVGSSHPAVALAFALLTLLGLGRLARRSMPLALATTVLAFAPTVGLLVLHPAWVHEPPILLRYQVGLVPLVLTLAAFGLTGLCDAVASVAVRGGHRAGWPHAVAGAALGVLLVTTGPLPETHGRTNSFTAIYPNARFWREADDTLPVPVFYREIGDDPTPGAVIEAPWHSRFAQQLDLYQQIHGRSVFVVADHAITRAPGFRLRKLLPLDFPRLEETDAAWLIVHFDPVTEDRFFARQSSRPPNVHRTWLPTPEMIFATAISRYGAPIYRDRWIAAFRIHQP